MGGISRLVGSNPTLSVNHGNATPKENTLFPGFLEGPAELAAERLLGCRLVSSLGGERTVLRIVETEAYGPDDAASHSFNGMTARNEVMFGPSGRLYVYFTYGMHCCANVVTGPPGHGAAALIRGTEPLAGIEVLERRRGVSGPAAVNGPAKLCQALLIDRELNGHDLRQDPLRLVEGDTGPDEEVIRTTRIGISKATGTLHRFLIGGNRFVSRRG